MGSYARSCERRRDLHKNPLARYFNIKQLNCHRVNQLLFGVLGQVPGSTLAPMFTSVLITLGLSFLICEMYIIIVLAS